MSTITDEQRGQTCFHPGEHLQEELDEIGMSTTTLAGHLGVSTDELVAVLGGHISVSAELAMRVGHFFGTTAQFWLNLQTAYDLEQAERRHRAEIESLPTLQAA